MTPQDPCWMLAGPALLLAALVLNLALLGRGTVSLRRALAGPAGLVQHLSPTGDLPPTGDAQIIPFPARVPENRGARPLVSRAAVVPRRRAA